MVDYLEYESQQPQLLKYMRGKSRLIFVDYLLIAVMWKVINHDIQVIDTNMVIALCIKLLRKTMCHCL